MFSLITQNWQGRPLRESSQTGEPRVRAFERNVTRRQERFNLFGSRLSARRLAHQGGKILLERLTRLVQLEHRGFAHGVLVEPRQVHQDMLRMQVVDVRLERQHEFEVALAATDHGILHRRPRGTSLAREAVDPAGVVAFCVHPGETFALEPRSLDRLQQHLGAAVHARPRAFV